MQIDQNTLCLFRKMQETDAACFSILTAPVLLPPEKAGSAGTDPGDTGFQKEWYGASPLAGSGSALADEGQDFRQKRGRSNWDTPMRSSCLPFGPPFTRDRAASEYFLRF